MLRRFTMKCKRHIFKRFLLVRIRIKQYFSFRSNVSPVLVGLSLFEDVLLTVREVLGDRMLSDSGQHFRLRILCRSSRVVRFTESSEYVVSLIASGL